MTKDQAIRLLRKNTSISEIRKLRDSGLSHTEVTDAIQEAMDLGAAAIEKQEKINEAIRSLEKMNSTHKKLFDSKPSGYNGGFAEGLEYTLWKLRSVK